MKLKVGDRVKYVGPSFNRKDGEIILLPGMLRYDSRDYVGARYGCVYRQDDGVERWVHQHNLVVLDREIIWEV